MTKQNDPAPARAAKSGAAQRESAKPEPVQAHQVQAQPDTKAASPVAATPIPEHTTVEHTQELYSHLKQLSEQKWRTGLPISHRLITWIIVIAMLAVTGWGLQQSVQQNIELYDARLYSRVNDVNTYMQTLALQTSSTAYSVARLKETDHVSYLRTVQNATSDALKNLPIASGIFMIRLSPDFKDAGTLNNDTNQERTSQKQTTGLYFLRGMASDDVTLEQITDFDGIAAYQHFISAPLDAIPPYFFKHYMYRGKDILEMGYPIFENDTLVGAAGVHIPFAGIQAIMESNYFGMHGHAHGAGHNGDPDLIDIFVFNPVQRIIELATDANAPGDAQLVAVLDQKAGEASDDFATAQAHLPDFYKALWRAFAATLSPAGPGDDFYIINQQNDHITQNAYIDQNLTYVPSSSLGTKWSVIGRIKAKDLGQSILADWLFNKSGPAILICILALLYNAHFHRLHNKLQVIGKQFRALLYARPIDFSALELKDKGIAGTFARIVRLWTLLGETLINHSRAMERGDYSQPVPGHNLSNVFDALEKARLGLQKSERAMQEKYDLIFNLFNLGTSAIALKDSNHKYVLVNENWQKLTGMSSDLVIGHSDFDLFDLTYAQAVHGIDQAVTLSGETNHTEWPGFSDNDNHIYFMTTFTFNPENVPISGVCQVIADVTAAATTQRQLSEQLSIQKDLFDSLPYPTLFIGPEGDVRDINRAGTEVFDLSPKDLIGKSVKTIPLLPKRYAKAINAELKRALKDKEAASQEISFRLKDKKMHHFVCWTRALSTVAAQGGLMVILMEITQTRKTQQKLLKQVEELASAKRASFNIMMDLDRERKEADELRYHAEAATRTKADFLATMSHEIRTPMNSIIGLLDLFMESELPKDQQVMLETVRDSAFSLMQIINDILDFSKIEAGKLLLESLPISIEDLTESSLETLLPSAHKKDLSISCWVDPDIPDRVLGDQVRLRQILFNLLGNAIKFTRTTAERKGQIAVSVRMASDGSSADNPRLEFSIRDNGVGIREEVLSTLFLPFMQAETSTTRRFGGTGLGLSISKNLIDLMDGAISASSVEGEGSVFTFYVPLIADSGHVPKSRPDLSDLRILLFLKDPLSATIAQTYLEAQNAFVERVDSPDDVVPRLKEATRDGQAYNVLVTNSRKKENDWPNLLSIIRRTKTISPINFVILTEDRRVRKGISLPDKVIADEMPIRRGPLIHAVALASGRVSPDSERAVQVARALRDIPGAEDAARQGRLILVVEDNLTNQYVIRRQLSVLGYACEIVNNGQEALEAMQEQEFGLVLTDCHMPVMDGYELTKAIRDQEVESADTDTQGEKRGRLPIVAITANALQGEGEACIEAGMDDYLPKPIELAKLQEVIRTWLPAERAAGGKSAPAPYGVESSATPLFSPTDDPSGGSVSSTASKDQDIETRPPARQGDENKQDILIDWPRLFQSTSEAKDQTLYRIDDALTMIDRRLEELLATKQRKKAVDQIKQIRLNTIAIYSGRLMNICNQLEETTLSTKAGRKAALDGLYQKLRDTVQDIRQQTKARRQKLMAEAGPPEDIDPATEEQTADVLAPDKLLNDFGGDTQIVKELISEFIKSSASTVEDIAEAASNQRWDDVRAGGHKLKSAARAIGAHELADLCNEIEFADNASRKTGQGKARKKSVSEIERLTERLPAVFQKVAEAAARLRLSSA